MASNYNEQHKAKLDNMVLGMPGVKVSKMFGYPGYKVNSKVFAFVGGDGIAIKLPKEQVTALLGTDICYSAFEPTPGKVWKEWLSIDREHSEDYARDQALIEASIRFVSGAD